MQFSVNESSCGCDLKNTYYTDAVTLVSRAAMSNGPAFESITKFLCNGVKSDSMIGRFAAKQFDI